ncbi:hypothetical protein [Chryseobacterium sp. JV274]|uniref:hypothetical protein n=1 Tax=Chryseobacterium sp. JV274 TaxID=1932669 RepID=UPI0015C20301|nr:hypothetical protein [Chryseobacterium sp. JV274]CAD0218289.1 membrane protein of unknown function [Chryseobacterium sp. JV274]
MKTTSQTDGANHFVLKWLFLVPLLSLAVSIFLYLKGFIPYEIFLITLISLVICLVSSFIALKMRKKKQGIIALWVFFIFLFLSHISVVLNILPPSLENYNPITPMATKKINIATYMANPLNSSEQKVKTAILFAWGDNTPDISKVANDKKISDYKLNEGQVFFLTDYLNIAVISAKPNGKRLHPADVKSSKNIQGLIDLLEKTIK